MTPSAPPNTMPWVSCRRLVIGYPGRPLSQPIDYNFCSGRSYYIRGGNGAGKSTFLRTLIGLHPALEGEVQVANGIQTAYLRQHATFDAGVSVSLKEFLSMGIPRGVSRQDKRQRLDQALTDFGFEKLTNTPVQKLSGGQFQLASLARATCADADILALDEPEVGIDRRGMERLEQHIIDFVERGKLVFVISHDLEFAMKVTDTCLAFRDGKLALETLS